jgi:hypothetical protein
LAYRAYATRFGYSNISGQAFLEKPFDFRHIFEKKETVSKF